MPVLSKRKNQKNETEEKIQKGSIVIHKHKKAIVLWTNEDGSDTVAISYLNPFHILPKEYRICLSELKPEKQKVVFGNNLNF